MIEKLKMEYRYVFVFQNIVNILVNIGNHIVV